MATFIKFWVAYTIVSLTVSLVGILLFASLLSWIQRKSS